MNGDAPVKSRTVQNMMTKRRLVGALFPKTLVATAVGFLFIMALLDAVVLQTAPVNAFSPERHHPCAKHPSRLSRNAHHMPL